MQKLLVLTLALLALADDKDINKDVLGTLACLDVTSTEFQYGINSLVETVENFNNIINGNNEKLDTCLSLGESNLSTVKDIVVAQCIIDLGNKFRVELTDVILQINTDVAYLTEKANSFFKCFLLNPYVLTL